MSKQLALQGGPKAFDITYPPHPITGPEERAAVDRVFERNQFSEFIASAGKAFFGGVEVQAFESLVAGDSDCAYGVAYNSWTSGLHGAVAACKGEYLDKVYTTCWTFTSSATSALMNNCVPVFVDVDAQTGNISAETLEAAIKRNPGGKILVLVHLFGLPADLDAILEVCNRHGIRVIEDAAQAPGATYKGRKIGSIGTCGGFSFTQSKTIHCGEGGVLVTNDEEVAEIARMVRNHGEAIATSRTYNSQFLGMGYRMTELEAAIGQAQWGKLEEFNRIRIDLNERFQARIRALCDFLDFPLADYDCEHVYYVTPILFDEQKAGIHRSRFCEALRAEGVALGEGYVKPLYFQDLYQDRNHHCLEAVRDEVSYAPGLCHNAEELHFNRLFLLPFLRPHFSDERFEQLIETFAKVIEAVPSLKE